MNLFARYWQKAVQKTRQYLSSPRVGQLKRKLAVARSEKQALLTELSSTSAELERIRHTDQEQLQVLEQRLGQYESDRESAQNELHALQQSLTEAVSRLEGAETQVTRLDARLEQERRRHKDEIKAAGERALSQERRLNRVLLLAGFAFVLGTVAGVVSIWDTQNNARVLAELSRDIKDIKAAMGQQFGSLPESLEDSRLSQSGDSGRGHSVAVPDALAAKPSAPSDRERTPTALSFQFHPHNRYRSRSDMEAFFEENAREPGVISLESGLQYRVLNQGKGRSPKSGDGVVFDYRAFLTDGTELYNSYEESDPVVFDIDRVTPALREALLRMEEGSEWELYIPPELAYRGGVRKRKKYGYEPLVYVVELRSVIEEGQHPIGN